MSPKQDSQTNAECKFYTYVLASLSGSQELLVSSLSQSMRQR